MTQDKMRRIITACVSAATVLLVSLLGFLIYQWVSMRTLDEKIEKLQTEIAYVEQQLAIAEEDREFKESTSYLLWKLDELKLKQDLIQGKQ